MLYNISTYNFKTNTDIDMFIYFPILIMMCVMHVNYAIVIG